MLCSSCGNEVGNGVKFCSRCGTVAPFRRGELLKIVLVLAMVPTLILGAVVLFSPRPSANSSPNSAPSANSPPSGRTVYGVKSAEAKTICEQFVSRRLKAPRGASFSHVWDTEILGSGDGPYEVRGFVDAQNSFGALLRNPYTCSVEAAGGESWKLLELDMQ